MKGLASFVLGLIIELQRATTLPVGGRYKPSTFYVRRGWRREDAGVYRRGLEFKSNVRILRISMSDSVGEVEAEVPSESGGGLYKVKLTIPLDFECNCPWGSHRFNPCKHVYATVLRVLEEAGVDVGDGILELIVYEGLNRIAYHKARIATSLT